MTMAMKIGMFVYGAAAILAGVVDLVWGLWIPRTNRFRTGGDNIPGQQVIAYIMGILLVMGGAAVLDRRSARFSAVIMAFVYLIVALFWLPRFYTAPLVLGHFPAVYIGVLGGVCQELIVVTAAIFLTRPSQSLTPQTC